MTMTLFHRLSGSPELALWRQPTTGRPVLYIHGSTFPAALSVGYRFDGASWADTLCQAGFDVWGLDFAGYGESRGNDDLPFVTVADTSAQISRAVEFISKTTSYDQILIIAHSWGSLPAGLHACLHPQTIKALALFGPIARRDGQSAPILTGWRLITAEDQYRRFVEDVPAHEPPVLSPDHFDGWAREWLATDPSHHLRTPPSVRVPNAPYNHLSAAWAGDFPYDPAELTCPTLVARGAWDSVCDAGDMAWFRAHIPSELFRGETIARGTHLLHLETNRSALYATVEDFFRKRT